MKVMRWQAEYTGQRPVEAWKQEKRLSKQPSGNSGKKQVLTLIRWGNR